MNASSAPKLAAIVLAAGKSTRMGQPKALLELDGRPLIVHLVNTLSRLAPFQQIIVVTGHEPKRIQQALPRNVTFAHNTHYERGEMISSVKIGVAALTSLDYDAFFLSLLDQPLVQHSTLLAMAQARAERRADIIFPAWQGKRGHPLLISSNCANTVLALPPAATLRDFVTQRHDKSEIVDVNDPGVLTDVDTPDDYQHIVSLWKRTSKPPA